MQAFCLRRALVPCFRQQRSEEMHRFRGAGSIVLLPRNDVAEELETIELPEGIYVTLYTSSMPYDPKPAGKLLAWMDKHRFVPDRQVVSCCLLDAVMRPEGQDADFCRLEIRIADGV